MWYPMRRVAGCATPLEHGPQPQQVQSTIGGHIMLLAGLCVGSGKLQRLGDRRQVLVIEGRFASRPLGSRDPAPTQGCGLEF